MKRAFLIALLYTAISVVLSYPIEAIGSKLVFVLALLALGAIFYFIFKKDLYTYEFAAVIFVELSIIVAISTFQARSQLYYTFWFNSLLVLFLTSLIACVLRFKPRKTLLYASYILIHGGLLVVALGFIINALKAQKIYFTLYKGEPTSKARVMRNIDITDREVEVPFTVELYDFKVTYYNEPELIFVYKKFGNNYKAIQSYPAHPGKSVKLPGLSFRVVDFDESGLFVVEKKEGIWKRNGRPIRLEEGKVVELGNKKYVFLDGLKRGEHFLALERKDGEKTLYAVKVGTEILVDSLLVKVLNFYPNFKYDVERGVATSEGKEPINPALEVLILYNGHVFNEFLFSKETQFGHPLVFDDFTLGYVYNPAIKIDIVHPDSIVSKEIKLRGKPTVTLEFNNGDTVRLELQGRPYYIGDFAVLLDKNPKQEKGYESLVRFTHNGKVEEAVIRVNKPYEYMGYKFYQSDYDPENPDFSGIMAVKEPGEDVIFVGLAIMFVGIIVNFIYRRRKWS